MVSRRNMGARRRGDVNKMVAIMTPSANDTMTGEKIEELVKPVAWRLRFPANADGKEWHQYFDSKNIADRICADWKGRQVEPLFTADALISISAENARLKNPWRDIGEPDDSAPFDGSPIIGGEVVNDGWLSYEMQYCSDEGHEGFYLAGYHWTDAVEGKVYPQSWMPMPTRSALSVQEGKNG